jgi:hypothetical protein
MFKNLIAIFLLFISFPIHSQTMWISSNSEAHIQGQRKIIPVHYNIFQLNDLEFKILQTKINNTTYQNILLPNPDGELELFKIKEEPILPNSLNEKYPNIKTYTAINIAKPQIVAKLDYTEFGFHAMISNGEKTYYVDPYSNINTGKYIAYYKKDIRKPLNERMQCLQNDENILTGGIDLQNDVPPLTGVNKVNGTMRKNYDLALACTGEYAWAVGGTVPTKASVLSAMVTSVNRVSGIYELEYAVHLNLIANNDTLVYLDSLTDPYTNDDGGIMLGENNANLSVIIGNANFDIGHVFSTGGGGVASLGSVCGNNKAQGVTGLPNPVGDGFDVDYVAHEMGHQFGGSHTFDALSGSCNGNRSSQSAYEVGSGTTIQAYAGICDYNDVQPHSDAYFSIRSLNQMGTFITTGTGKNCPDSIAYGNTAPTFPAILDTFYIPYLTYFELSNTAADAENDPITYCWEQYNRGTQGMDWDAPTILNPIFRSFNPTSNNTRIFPVIDSCINNVYKYLGERSPDTARSMRFKLAVRDVHNGFGCFNYSEDSLVVKVLQGANLFRVTSQNTSGLTLHGGATYPVNWVVAGTDTGLISATNVNIYLSTDSGYTYPITLAANVANDGLQNVILPNINVAKARIKVKGAGNIFFDLNDTPFAIKSVAEGFNNTTMSFIEAYPNPTNNLLQLKNINESISIQIINSVGQNLYSAILKRDGNIDMQSFAKGLYLLHLRNAKNELQIIKVIKD